MHIVKLNPAGRHRGLIQGEIVLARPAPVLRFRSQPFAHRVPVHVHQPVPELVLPHCPRRAPFPTTTTANQEPTTQKACRGYPLDQSSVRMPAVVPRPDSGIFVHRQDEGDYSSSRSNRARCSADFAPFEVCGFSSGMLKTAEFLESKTLRYACSGWFPKSLITGPREGKGRAFVLPFVTGSHLTP
jgi:hypothetical protein